MVRIFGKVLALTESKLFVGTNNQIGTSILRFTVILRSTVLFLNLGDTRLLALRRVVRRLDSRVSTCCSN